MWVFLFRYLLFFWFLDVVFSQNASTNIYAKWLKRLHIVQGCAFWGSELKITPRRWKYRHSCTRIICNATRLVDLINYDDVLIMCLKIEQESCESGCSTVEERRIIVSAIRVQLPSAVNFFMISLFLIFSLRTMWQNLFIP